MKSIAKILLATEFAPSCDRAREHAAALAAATGAELHVLHVQVLHGDQYGWAGIPNVREVEDALAQNAAAQMSKYVDSLGTGVIHAVERDVTAAPAILRYAEQQGIDLIVMGTHARKGLARLVLGSVVAEVVRRAPMPVLTIGPEHALNPEGYQCLLAAVDFSDVSVLALRQAAEAARLHQARLVVVHVVETRPLPPYYTDEFAEAARKRARGVLNDLIREAQLPVKAEAVVAVGVADQQLVAMAREHDADLMVLGMTGLSMLDHLLVGSTTDRVIRKAPCPVLVQRGEPSSNI